MNENKYSGNKLLILCLLTIIAIETITIGRDLKIPLFDYFGFITQVGLLYIAVLALQQVKLIREQNIITRQSVAVNELKSFQKWVINFDNLNKKVKEKGKIVRLFEMDIFNNTESLSQNFSEGMKEEAIFYNEHQDIYIEGVERANELEAISVSFVRGVADISVVEGSMCETFCAFVETYAYFYCSNRNEANKNYIYNNTIMLYKNLKCLIGSREEQLNRLITEHERINS